MYLPAQHVKLLSLSILYFLLMLCTTSSLASNLCKKSLSADELYRASLTTSTSYLKNQIQIDKEKSFPQKNLRPGTPQDRFTIDSGIKGQRDFKARAQLRFDLFRADQKQQQRQTFVVAKSFQKQVLEAGEIILAELVESYPKLYPKIFKLKGNILHNTLTDVKIDLTDPSLHPLEKASLIADEDMVLTGQGKDGQMYVAGGAVYTPTRWNLPEQTGRSMAEVHAPFDVDASTIYFPPGTPLKEVRKHHKYKKGQSFVRLAPRKTGKYKGQKAYTMINSPLGSLINRVTSSFLLESNIDSKVIIRNNWFIESQSNNAMPSNIALPNINTYSTQTDISNIGQRSFLRSEFESLSRVGDLVLFTIKVRHYQMQTAITVPTVKESLHNMLPEYFENYDIEHYNLLVDYLAN